MNKNLTNTYYGKKIDTPNILNIDDVAKKISTLRIGKKVCVVTGVTGQDGSYMAEYLLHNTDIIVIGGVRRLSVYNHVNLKNINNERFLLLNFDLTDSHSISKTVEKIQPDFFINLAAQSYVASSWDFARQTWSTNSTAVLDILEAVRTHKPTCKLYQAGSSEEFGNVMYTPQNESHPLRPRSPYGASKAAARQLIKVYRESYDLFAIQGWLFNHESERRGMEFVTRKITHNVARIKTAIKHSESFEPLELGNIDAKRDWSHALDFVEGIWLMLNQPKPVDYILSSNETHTVREFVEKAFQIACIEGEWKGVGIDEKFVMKNAEDVVLMKINSRFYRPAEVELLLGDSTLARKELNWSPSINFDKLVERMVKHDLEQYE